jgi:hypothetical protein
MTEPAERLKSMRQQGLRELRLAVPDARLRIVRQRVAEEVAHLRLESEHDAIAWIESVSEFGADEAR